MTAQVDVTGFTAPGSNSVTTTTFIAPINLGSGPYGTLNRALAVAICFVGSAGGTSSGVSVTWDGVAMTQLTSAGNGGDIFLFGLINPNTGSKNLVVNWTGANQIEAGLLSAVGADTASIAAAFPAAHLTTNTGTNSPNSVAITNAAGNVAFAGHVVTANFTTAGNTDIGHNNTGNLNSGAANYDTAVNPTLTYAFNSGNTWASVGCEIAALGGGGGASIVPLYMHRTQQRLN